MADQPQGDNPQNISRYEQAKRILAKAQGKATPGYQGYRKFWNLPLEEFFQVTIYGIRMIADEGEEIFVVMRWKQPPRPVAAASQLPQHPEAAPAESGCGSSESTSTLKASKGRGAASGLIEGLKGHFPFDGRRLFLVFAFA